MAKIYTDLRKVSGRDGNDSRAADIMHHLYTRQYLGKVVVVCEQPIVMLSAARKQWLKLSRSLQRQRASTLNADKILKYTHGIAHMQRMRFSAKMPLERPETDVFFLPADKLQVLPARCFTVYITAKTTLAQIRELLSQLPADALLVDYVQQTDWLGLGVESKNLLDARVAESWKQVRQFLDLQGVDISALHKNELHSVEATDDALDTLLAVSHRFLTIAAEFQHTMELARPMRIHKTLREKYDMFILLAHRVQALTPGAFSQQFLQAYNEDDTYFFYDHNKERLLRGGETLEESFARHMRAGRKHLAHAMQHTYMGRSFSPIL